MTTSSDSYWTGQVDRRWGFPVYIERGCNVGINRPYEYWAKHNLDRCLICHPSPVPPFPDCPHGHYLTPARIEAQIHWDWISRFWWYTGIDLICIFIFHMIPILTGITAFLWVIFVIFFLIDHRMSRTAQRRLAGAGPWAEYPTYRWEKRTRRNEPWVRRVF